MAGSAGGGGCGLGRCRGIPRQVTKRPNARCSDKKRGKRSEIDVRVAGFNRLSSGSPASLKFAWLFPGYARTGLSRMEVGAHEAARDNGGAPRGPITGRCPAGGAGGRTRSRSFDVRQEKRRRPVARAPYSVGLCLRAPCDRRLHNPAGTAASTAPRRHLHVTFTFPPVREVTGRVRPSSRPARRGSQGRTRPVRGAPPAVAGGAAVPAAGGGPAGRGFARRRGAQERPCGSSRFRGGRSRRGCRGGGRDRRPSRGCTAPAASGGTGFAAAIRGREPMPPATAGARLRRPGRRAAPGGARRGPRPPGGAPVGELDTDHT